MLPELPEDMLDIVLIDKEVAVHDSIRLSSAFIAIKDFLLVSQRGLRIRDQEGRDHGMCAVAFTAHEPLHLKNYALRHVFYSAPVMAMAGQAPLLPAGTLQLVYGNILNHLVIKIL